MDPLLRFHQQWIKLNPTLRNIVERSIEKLPLDRIVAKFPQLRLRMEQEFASILSKVEIRPSSLQSYPSHKKLPPKGQTRAEVFSEMERMAAEELSCWRNGYASGAVYHGGDEHINFLDSVYSLFSQANPLHVDIWPSIAKFEGEVVAMVGKMLGSEACDDKVCGSITSGGTESILLAMKTYRDQARRERGITRPELVVPSTAHVAFDKACQYFGIKKVEIPVDAESRLDISTASRAINKNTVGIIGSAPNFPHGIVDPILELSRLAKERGCNLHVDCCLGGFILPWVKDRYQLDPFDFSLPGVTSISVDTHKYGYSSKGSSVVLYRSPELRHYQYYVAARWPGGLYASPTFAGSRSGALIAQCWATLVTTGVEGYRQAAEQIVSTAQKIRSEAQAISELEVIGDPLFVLAFRSHTINIFAVMEQMRQLGWSLNGLHRPDCFHLCVTLLHTQDGVADQFLSDLHSSVEQVVQAPLASNTRMAPIYGMASALPARGMVAELMKRYLDRVTEA